MFSTFGVKDHDGDVVLASAFTPGQPVPMVWAHDWSAPIGRGQVAVSPTEATFNGRFFLETQRGDEAYKSVKAMADLQEWSWGFRVLDGDRSVQDGEDVFVIKRAELYEVSPVLVGAGIGTRTTALKGYGMEYEEHAARVQDEIRELIDRTKAGLAKRAADGHGLGERRRGQVDAVIAALESATAELRGLMAQGSTVSPDRLHLDFLRIQATLNGVATQEL